MFKNEEDDKIEHKGNNYVEEVKDWGTAAIVSKIPRMSWKKILGVPLNKYIKDIKDENLTKEQIIEEVMKKVYEKDKIDNNFFKEWTVSKIKQNIEIRISSCKSEMELYEVDNNIDVGEEDEDV